MSTRAEIRESRSGERKVKTENNKRRLERILRSIMRSGLEFSAVEAFSAVSLSRVPHRVIE